jgi:hypothetical protein
MSCTYLKEEDVVMIGINTKRFTPICTHKDRFIEGCISRCNWNNCYYNTKETEEEYIEGIGVIKQVKVK